MALRRRDLAALLLAAVTALAGLAAWAMSSVELGLVLGTNGLGRVVVSYVAPESIAARSGFYYGQLVTALEATDTGQDLNGDSISLPEEYGGGKLSLPAEPLPDQRIQYVEVGAEFSVDDQPGGEIQVYPGAMSLYRPDWELRLSTGEWLLILGAGAGVLIALAAGRGSFGASWTEDGPTLGAAVAIPFMATPLLYNGTPAGMAGAFLLAAAGALPLARSLSDRLTIERWPAMLFAASMVVALTVGLTVFRGLNARDPVAGDPFDRVLLLASITILPAAAAAFGLDRNSRERTELMLVGLGPGAAVMLLGSAFPNPAPVLGWLLVALGWRRFVSRIRGVLERRKPVDAVLPPAVLAEPPLEPIDAPAWRVAGLRGRDLAALAIAAVAVVGGLVAYIDTATLVIGCGLGGVVGLAIRNGFLGPAWRQAAIPLGCAVAVPIIALGWGVGGASSAATVLSSVGALPAAHLLAYRHPDRAWRRIVFLLAAGLAIIAVSSVVLFEVSSSGWYVSGLAERYLLMGMITLVPGLIVAFSSSSAGGGRITDRLDTLVVGLTPGAAMTVLVPSFGGVLLAAWLIGLVAWRRLTITPLLSLAQRTQRQRDLAVVAVEAERARLAADLHDDALQELSALVRRLDAAGDAEGADLARGVAERLRTITSDLRLPVLDDLGAGPALEWLVGRVRPLADGPVVLERVDSDRPPAGVELAVFRVAQEALANAVKHGKPPITVRYRVAEDGGVSLSVDDSGPGIDTGAAEAALQAGHLGMANMQQRAEQIGALLDVRRWPAGGTHVAMEWRPR
jgi:signal transduction histidine kinase